MTGWLLILAAFAAALGVGLPFVALAATREARSRPIDRGTYPARPQLPPTYSPPQIYRTPRAQLSPNQAYALIERRDDGTVSIRPVQ